MTVTPTTAALIRATADAAALRLITDPERAARTPPDVTARAWLRLKARRAEQRPDSEPKGAA